MSKIISSFELLAENNYLYAKCPAIRKIEEKIPYHLESVGFFIHFPNHFVVKFLSFRISFFESNGSMMSMTNLSTGKTIDRIMQVPLEDAAEKFALYNLSRKGTHIKRLDMGVSLFRFFCSYVFFPILQPGPAFIVNCVPIAIKNLTVRKASKSSWFPTVSPIENVKTDGAIREDTVSFELIKL